MSAVLMHRQLRKLLPVVGHQALLETPCKQVVRVLHRLDLSNGLMLTVGAGSLSPYALYMTG